MKSDNLYIFMTFLIIFIIIELTVALTNQYYVPRNKKYNELTGVQKFLVNSRFYLNILETIILIYVLANYSKYFNHLIILLLVFIFTPFYCNFLRILIKTFLY